MLIAIALILRLLLASLVVAAGSESKLFPSTTNDVVIFYNPQSRRHRRSFTAGESNSVDLSNQMLLLLACFSQSRLCVSAT